MHTFLSYRQKLIAAGVILLAVFFVSPSSFVVENAGPALDVNGMVSQSLNGEAEPKGEGTGDSENTSTNRAKLVSISGVATYPSDSHFFLTTVTAWGTPDSGASGLQALKALFDPRDQLYPLQAQYPQGISTDQAQKLDAQQMEYSQDSAAATALTLAGYDVHEKLTVAAINAEYPSGAVLHEGDVITGVRLSAESNTHSAGEADSSSATKPYTPVTNFMDLSSFLENTEPGTSIDVQIERNGATHEVSFTTGAPAPDSTGWIQPGSVAGVSLEVSDIQLSADVKYAIDNIGGPSAGMMFALGIYDQLTEGSLAGSEHIAGTGTISWNGRIGPIGGIEHKMRGAASKGVKHFLAPAENCPQTVGHEPTGMKIWAVRTINDAISAAQAIGSGQTDALTSLTPCSAISVTA